MSIAHKLHWTTASKPMPGKATEHSGAKKGKGAWDKKKTAKKTSNKGRRAGGKQEIKDQTVGDESDGPFPGAAPLFTKAASLNWGSNADLLPEWKGIDLRGVSTPALELATSLLNQTLAEPRPCYPSEEPVEDHCNDGIAPPAPGGGDDMDYEPDPDLGQDMSGPGATPNFDADDDPNYRHPDDDYAHELEQEDDYQFEPSGGPELSPNEREDYGWDDHDPGSQEDRGAGGRQRGPRDLPMSGPHDQRDPDLPDSEPHQFWAQDAPHIQDALNKYLMPQLDSPNPKIAQKARMILKFGPHAGN